VITNEADLKQFDELLGCAKTVFPYVENHLFYVEHWFHSVFWNKMREVAAIIKEHGLIKEIEDIWLLRRDEIKRRCGTSSPPGPPASRRAAPRPGRRKSSGARASWRSSASGARRRPSASHRK
jgi:hypothetical protein